MDSADTPPEPSNIHNAVSHQGVLLGHHEQSIRSLFDAHQQLTLQVSELGRQLNAFISNQAAAQPSPQATTLQSETHQVQDSSTIDPEPFSGQSDLCRGFLFQCETVFSQRPMAFALDISKIRYMCGLMKGKALKWAEAKFSSKSMDGVKYVDFVKEVKRVFDHPDYQSDASSRLMSMSQGQRSVSDYTIEFWTMAAEVDWTDQALQAAFRRGLSEQIKDELLSRDEPANLDSLVSLANRIDNRIRARRREKSSSSTRPVTRFAAPLSPQPSASSVSPGLDNPVVNAPEPMQLGRAHLTPEERQRRRQCGECLYCGKVGHFLASCPIRPKGGAHQ